MNRRVSATALPFAFTLLVLTAICQDPIANGGIGEEIELQPGHALLDPGIDIELRAEAPLFEPGSGVTLVLENRFERGGVHVERGEESVAHGLRLWPST
jgi:hypothetical protein